RKIYLNSAFIPRITNQIEIYAKFFLIYFKSVPNLTSIFNKHLEQDFCKLLIFDIIIMKVLILGASLNPSRYAYMALNDLVDRAHSVIGVGNREGELRGVKIVKSLPIDSDIHTVTLYLGPQNQEPYYNYL